MRSRRFFASLFGGLLAATLAATDVQSNVVVKVDGVEVPGVIGYRIEFNRQTVPKTDSRRLDLAYSPNERRLVMSVNQKGLKGLQDWLNLATDGGTPTARVVTLSTHNESDDVLVAWELSGVLPTTLSQAASGPGPAQEVTATLEFVFDRMRLVEASGK